MIMFLVPYAVDVPFDRRPVMNWILVISVVAAFGLQISATYGAQDMEAVDAFVLDGWRWQGLIGHMWLHADPIHLGGNMLFLWIFGNAVCAKVGNLKYLPIYLGAGLCAAMAHLLLNGEPAVGASGAINGIVGMFLVFFWQNEMDCLFFVMVFLRPVYKTFSVSSYWIILLFLVFDIAGAILGGGRVAYFAHLGGFVGGALFAVLLLKLRWVTMYRDEQSLVGLFEDWKQDREDMKLERMARAGIEKADQAEYSEQDSSPEPNGPLPQTAPASYVKFTCPCGKEYRAPIGHAGKKGRCSQCQQLLIIPAS